jgi:transposase-like protein
MTAIPWSQIEAECGDYRAGFVATFHKYEGRDTDEIAGNGQIIRVTASSFARHVGIARQTFERWVKAADQEGTPNQGAESVEITARSARASARNLPPEERAKLAAELLNDEEVTEQPEARTAVAKASIAAQRREQERTEHKRASDPVGRRMDENIALLDLQLAINGFVRKATDLLPNVGPVAADQRPWLKGEADRLEIITAEVRYLADHGETRTDAELRAMTGGV